MKKWLLIVPVMAVMLASCQKEVNAPACNGVRLTLGATFQADSKLDWTGSDEAGYKATFNSHDRLLLYFRNASGTQVGQTFTLPIDISTLSADGRKAAFTGNDVTVPEGATQIFSYLDNDAEPDYMTYGSTPFVELATQGGTLAEATGRQIIAGSLPLEGLHQESGSLAGNIDFHYRTAILKLELSFPEGSVPAAQTPVTLYNEDKTFYNRIRLYWGEPFYIANRNTKGPITTHAGAVEGNTLHSWICIWAGDSFNGTTIEIKDGQTTWTATFDPQETPQAGKLYRVRRTLSAWEPETGGGGITGGGYTEK